MTSRRVRRFYYASLRIPMWVNGRVYRYFRQPGFNPKVHLGCGQVHYIDGWLNLDANIVSARPDLWANLLDPLPFRNSSVAAFYSFHVIEHLPDEYLPTLFKEMHRCLVPGGWIRIGGPDAESSARKLLEKDGSWFSDFPDCRRSVGGRFANLMLCRGEHVTLLTASYLEELLVAVGFKDVHRRLPVCESAFDCQEVLAHEHEDDFECPHSLIVEATKPELRSNVSGKPSEHVR